MPAIDPVVAAKAADAGAQDWLAGLDGLVRARARAWGLRLGPVLPGATESLVLGATTADGRPAVLKFPIPSPEQQAAVTALGLIPPGAGPDVLAHDPDSGALLLEALGPSMSRLGLPRPVRHRLLARAARRWWIPVADGAALPDGAAKAEWLATHIARRFEALGRPCSVRARDQAMAAAARRGRAHDPGRAVLVHGDVHQWNALTSARGWRLIDPGPLRAEPEYDLGVILREDAADLLAGGPGATEAAARALAAATGTDPAAVFDWGLVERCSTGLLLLAVGREDEGRPMLALADHLAGEGPPAR